MKHFVLGGIFVDEGQVSRVVEITHVLIECHGVLGKEVLGTKYLYFVDRYLDLMSLIVRSLSSLRLIFSIEPVVHGSYRRSRNQGETGNSQDEQSCNSLHG